MTVAVTRRPTTTVTAGLTALHVIASDVTENESNGSQRLHYLTLTASGETTLRSQNFAGDWTWDGIIIPAAGSWTATLVKASDDSSVATLAITAV